MSAAIALAFLVSLAGADGLPQGALTMFSGNSTGVSFLVADSVDRTPGGTRASILTVYLEPIPGIEGGMIYQLIPYDLDCAGRRTRITEVRGYDADGRQLVHFGSEGWEAAADRSMQDFALRVVCDSVQLPPNNTVQGAAAARALARVARQSPTPN